MANNFKRTAHHSLQIDFTSGTRNVENTPSVTPEPWPPAPEPQNNYWLFQSSGYVMGYFPDDQNMGINVYPIESGRTEVAFITNNATIQKWSGVFYDFIADNDFVLTNIDESLNFYLTTFFGVTPHASYIVKVSKDKNILYATGIYSLDNPNYPESYLSGAIYKNNNLYISAIPTTISPVSNSVFGYIKINAETGIISNYYLFQSLQNPDLTYNSIYSQTLASGDDGSVYLYGSSSGEYVPLHSPNKKSGFGFAKFNSSGAVQWCKFYYVSNDFLNHSQTFVYDCKIDKNNNIYYICYVANNNQYILTKLDPNGNVLWAYSTTTDQFYSIYLDNNNDVYLTIYNLNIVVKLDPNGNTIWCREFSFIDNAENIYFAETQGNNIYIVCDTVMMKLPNDGSLTGTYTIGTATFTYAPATYNFNLIVFDSFENITLIPYTSALGFSQFSEIITVNDGTSTFVSKPI